MLSIHCIPLVKGHTSSCSNIMVALGSSQGKLKKGVMYES